MLDAVAERGRVKGIGRLRLLIGVAAGVGGMAIFLANSNLLETQPGIVVAVAATAVGVGLIAGPWGWRLVQALGDERRGGLRAEGGGEVAAPPPRPGLPNPALIQRPDPPPGGGPPARDQERGPWGRASGRPPVRG